jgi:ketosteroid isomerase-like protein
MSRENVEIAQAAFAAWNLGDMDALRELYDPDAIARPLENWLDGGLAVGRDAILRQFERIREALDHDVLEPVTEFTAIADHVVVRYLWQGTGHGPDMNMDMTLIYTIRRSRIFEVEFFWDYAEALEAVGLRE